MFDMIWNRQVGLWSLQGLALYPKQTGEVTTEAGDSVGEPVLRTGRFSGRTDDKSSARPHPRRRRRMRRLDQ